MVRFITLMILLTIVGGASIISKTTGLPFRSNNRSNADRLRLKFPATLLTVPDMGRRQ
jgi:hypothetical protein